MPRIIKQNNRYRLVETDVKDSLGRKQYEIELCRKDAMKENSWYCVMSGIIQNSPKNIEVFDALLSLVIEN